MTCVLAFQPCICFYDIFRSRVDVEVGKFVKIAINHEVVKLLENDDQCVSEYEYGSYDGCIYNELYNISMSEVGCTVPWLLNKNNTCTDDEDSQKAFQTYQQNRRNQNNICPNPCTFTNMYFGPPVTGT